MSQRKEISRHKIAAATDYKSKKQDLKGDDADIVKDWFEPEVEIKSELNESNF